MNPGTLIGTIWEIVGWLSLPVLLLLAPLLVRRGIHRAFPFFVYYIWTSAIMGLLRLGMSRASLNTYFYVSWVTEALSIVFAFFATYELFVKRLFPHFYKVSFYRHLFPSVAIVITLAVAMVPYSYHSQWLFKALHSVDVVRVLTIMFFAALMILMGRTWSKYEFGIAFGMGVEAAFVLTSMAIWARTGQKIRYGSITAQLPSIGYDLACLIWLVYFWRSEKTVPTIEPVSPQALQQAKAMEVSIKGWLSNKKPSRE